MTEGGLKTVAQKNAALLNAAKAGYVEDVQTLVQSGANLNACDNTGVIALHWAAFHAHEEVLRVLIDLGADLEAHDRTGGGTPLHYACSRGNVREAKLLVESGANLNSRDNEVRIHMKYLKITMPRRQRYASVRVHCKTY
jgi:ankyrin repeat protein